MQSPSLAHRTVLGTSIKARLPVTRALGSSNVTSSSDVKQLTHQFVSIYRDAVDIAYISSEDLENSMTSIVSSATESSQGLYAGLSNSLQEALENVQGISGSIAAASEKAADLSLTVLTESTSATEKLSSVVSQNLAGAQDAFFEVTTELVARSSDLSAQLSSALERQLSSIPEYEARFVSGADALSRKVSDLGFSDALNHLMRELEASTSLAADGQFVEAITTPGGAAVTGTVVIISVLLGISAAGGSESKSKADSQLSYAVSSSQTQSQEAETSTISAREWIAQWRSSQAIENLPTDSSSPGHELAHATNNGANGSSAETHEQVLENGAKNPENGAVKTSEVPVNFDSGVTEPSESVVTTSNTAIPIEEAESVETATQSVQSQLSTAVSEKEEGASAFILTFSILTFSILTFSILTFSILTLVPDFVESEFHAATPVVTSICLRYFSGWEQAVIHVCVAGEEWVTCNMEREPDGPLLWRGSAQPGAQLEGGGVAEFVITDGQGDWDKPPSGDNYRLYSIGTFELRDGALESVA